jgi:hypothetical protein
MGRLFCPGWTLAVDRNLLDAVLSVTVKAQPKS